MENNKKNISLNYDSTNLASLLLVLFICLKLTGHIGWSWWWVLSPLWIQFAILFGAALMMVIIGGVLFVLGWAWDRVADWRRGDEGDK